jgi:competence protein ComEA
MKPLISVVLSLLLVCLAAPMSFAEAEPDSGAELASLEAININTADVETLTRLEGIGEKKAQAIVTWREENGDFVSVEQLVEISGIGAATLEANRDRLRI